MAQVSSGLQHPRASRIILGTGFLIAAWNFVLMFRGWVVAPQAEVMGAHIFFFFLGVAPWIGMIAAARRKRWGAWIVFLSPFVSLTGLAFTDNTEWEQTLIVTAITVGPAVFIGAILLKAITPQKTSVESTNSPS
jgi:hypothetical protein